MKIHEFKYAKLNDPMLSDRKVLVLRETDEFVEGIDLSHLSATEVQILEEANAAFDRVINSIVSKSFRRFKKDLIR